jgi:chorismate mutase
MEIIKIKDWNLGIDTTKPIVVSGPCSAETEEQTIQSCIGVAEQGANILRAGIWKPRTRPGSFEGVGNIGLPWLKTASRLTGLPITVEVANARHVYEALKNQVDILWIGARTTVNPFSVQEIAEALKGVDIPVMIKNPINPDLKLWMGAFERFEKVGIHKLAAIHRGFASHHNTEYRNQPQWEIPIELRRNLDVEMICDPSHICGRRDTLLNVSQKAMDLNFDGLMIESHITPDEAWSDAAQQVTPVGFGEIIRQLVVRDTNTSNASFNSKLEELRHSIDELDETIIQAIAKRMEIAREIGEYKKDNNITILQMSRWEKVLARRSVYAQKQGLSSKFVAGYLTQIHKESIRQQTAIMNEAELNMVDE